MLEFDPERVFLLSHKSFYAWSNLYDFFKQHSKWKIYNFILELTYSVILLCVFPQGGKCLANYIMMVVAS